MKFETTHFVLCIMMLIGCQGNLSGGGGKANSRVITGAERLLTDEYFLLIKNKRLGLVTNHTAQLPDGRHLADVLHDHPDVQLTVLFGPEHGIRGDVDAHVADGIDHNTNLPVISLYGKIRKPTPEMLKDVDVLLFDIQDIGARFYTYIATMNNVLEAAAENDIPYIVLDRPNPIGAIAVDGPIGASADEPVTGPAQIPVTHGMTVGELAQMFNGERMRKKLRQAKLTVVPMENYNRSQWFDETGLPWIKPSPNMLTLATATLYPGTCLLEGTNVSEARGTLHPFEHIGAPWIDGEDLSRQLNGYGLNGVTFKPDTFIPDSIVDGIRIHPPKFVGERCASVRIVVTDRQNFEPVQAGIYILHALLTLFPEDFQFREARLDRLVRTPLVRQQLEAGKSPPEIITQWEKGLAGFMPVRQKYLIY